MSAQSFSIQRDINENKLAVSFRLLMGLYLIIPLCLLIKWVDGWFWGGYLLTHLPSSPTHYLLFQILFGTPHIVASAILLASNSEYVHFYKNKILAMTAFIIVFFGIGSLFIPYKVLYLITASWTVYHVLKQQHGIGKGVCRLPAWAFYLLLWLSVAAGIFIYVGIFLKNSLDAQQSEWIRQIAATLTALLVVASIASQRQVQTTFGKFFMWGNTLLIVSSFYLYTQQYYFLAILIPRLVHDATAYIFYVTHDYNKHHRQPRNWLYQYAARCNVHVFIVLPVLSFLLAFLLQAYGDELVNFITQTLFGTEIYKAITLGLLGYLALMHYYTESFVWSAGSPLRQYIRFKL
ncbi:hypothetical protein Q9L42_017480 [Methylomarinum sp. Ch1-1]|uniref:Uncharacterized protein n=1 Tax=Methylomarinum roseum TaxID=3067653 RepID=A0AAU7NSZ3_9GAMM|nr:hypothetical protein [Methylomarinum sp. Ch1-1]MDP4519879.1 hypothetical protein [Methylomarinum sp. Ch1-1]